MPRRCELGEPETAQAESLWRGGVSLDEDGARQGFPEGMRSSFLIFYGDNAVEIAHLLDPQEAPRDELALAEVVERRDVFVADLGDADPLTSRRFAQREGVVRLEASVRGRDGTAVGVVAGMIEKLGQSLREPVRNRVLQELCLLMHLLPGVPEVLDEEGLDQTMPPYQPQGLPSTALRERSSPVSLVPN